MAKLDLLVSIVVPIAVFVGAYYTFERAMRESGGTKAGYIILGVLLVVYGISAGTHLMGLWGRV